MMRQKSLCFVWAVVVCGTALALRPENGRRTSREDQTCWPAPEHPETMNRKQLGNLALSSEEEDKIGAFLKTLTDGYTSTGK
jgi:hypothetical protein